MSKKPALGSTNPLDAYYSDDKATAVAERVAAPVRNIPVVKSITRKRESVYVDVDLMNRVRNTVFALSGPPHCLDLSKFAESAFEHEADRIVQESNGGTPFPARSRDKLRPGRRAN